jgi:hypothetical protein
MMPIPNITWCLANSLLAISFFLLDISTPALFPFMGSIIAFVLLLFFQFLYFTILVLSIFQGLIRKQILGCALLNVFIVTSGPFMTYTIPIETRVHFSNTTLYLLNTAILNIDLKAYDQYIGPTEPDIILSHADWGEGCRSELIYDPHDNLLPSKFVDHELSVYHITSSVVSRFTC